MKPSKELKKERKYSVEGLASFDFEGAKKEYAESGENTIKLTLWIYVTIAILRFAM